MLQGGHERLTDRQTDGQTGWIQYTPTNFVAGGIIIRDQETVGVQAGGDPPWVGPPNLGQSDRQFVYKCTKTPWLIRSQETAGIQWSKTQSWSGLGSTIMNVSNKFENNPLNGSSGNVWKLLNQRPRNSRNSAKCDQKLLRLWEYHNECIHKV